MTLQCTTCGHGYPIFLFRLSFPFLMIWIIMVCMITCENFVVASSAPQSFPWNTPNISLNGSTEDVSFAALQAERTVDASIRIPSREPCGDVLIEPQGTITTPNFPKAPNFSIPVTCHWRIFGGPGSRITVLLTELYIHSPDSISIAVYDDPSSVYFTPSSSHEVDNQVDFPGAHVEKDWVEINLENFPQSSVIETSKQVLVVTLHLEDSSLHSGSTDLHGLNPTTDFHGLNLTYFVTPRTDQLSLTSRFSDSVCSYPSCAHLGRCLVDKALNSTFCVCEQGYSGKNCQFGPECTEPDEFGIQLQSPCGNRGFCRYQTADRVICACKEKFMGERCDVWRNNALPDCEKLHCDDICDVDRISMTAFCSCSPGRILEEDGRTCSSRNQPMVRAVMGSSTTAAPHACRKIYQEQRGVISSPNYPHAFPIPIQCEWIIHAGANRQTVIFFNEIYLRDTGLLQVSSYDKYKVNGESSNEHVHGGFTFETYPDHLTITKPFIVLRMSLRRDDFTRTYPFARVRNFLLDIFGFNITYITYPANKPAVQRNHVYPCTGPFDCSFVGQCKTSSDFQNLYCECFEGHFGPHCEYGPKCSPSSNPPENPCFNNGTCKYWFGTLNIGCECPLGFGGARCEKLIEMDDKCKELKCSHRCNHTNAKSTCECRYGFQLEPDGKSCRDIGGRQLLIIFYFKNPVPGTGLDVVTRLRYIAPGLQDCRSPISLNSSVMHIRCKSPNSGVEENLRRQLNASRGTDDKFLGIQALRYSDYDMSRYFTVRMVNLTVYSQEPTLEKSELAIVCVAEGSPMVTFSWKKDGIIFDPSRMRDMWLTRIDLPAMGQISVQLNIENVRRVHQGVYSCIVNDFGDTALQSVYVEVVRTPEMELYPVSLFVRRGEDVAVTCMTTQKSNFRWYKKGEEISFMTDPSSNSYDIQPDRGRQLTVTSIAQSAHFTCIASNGAGSKEQTAYVKVLEPHDLVCQPERSGKVHWSMTGADADSEQNCPDDMQGTARRHCDRQGQWMMPSFDDCASVPLLRMKTAVDSIQAGFGDRDAANLKSLMAKLNDFVSSRTVVRGRDMDNAVEMLDILHKLNMALVDSEAIDATVDEFWLNSVKRLLDHADTKGTVLNIFDRFPFVTLWKTLLGAREYFHIQTGTASCSNHTEPTPQDGNHTWVLSEGSFDCFIFPYGIPDLPKWMKVKVVLNVLPDAVPKKEIVAQTRIELSTTANGSIDSGHGIVLPETAYVWLPDASSFVNSIIANVTFTDFAGLLPGDWKQASKASVGGIVMYNITCIQRHGVTTPWSSESCNTSVILRESMDLISHVQCLCSLSTSSHFFTLKLTNYSSSHSQTLAVPPGVRSDVIVAVVVSFAVVIIVILICLWCFQRRKIMNCMVAVKKRTSDFVRIHFGLPEIPTSEQQLELSMLPEERTSPQSGARQGETATLMTDAERRLSDSSQL